MSKIQVNSQLLGLKDSKLHVDDHGGEGRPLVLIHGWPLSGASWEKQISTFKDAGFRVITYDRRGFGKSDKPKTGYDYDTLTDDLAGLIDALDLKDITLVGFSMGGGEVARYIAKYGEESLHSVVFASSITPMMMMSPNNPDGPLEKTKAMKMTTDLTSGADAFYDQFTKDFFSPNADGNILISEEDRQKSLALCKQADKVAALEAMQSFGTSDFREDIKKVTVPTLIIHGDADGIVPFKGSGDRTNRAISHSKLHVIAGGPHGINVSHSEEFNTALLDFLKL